MSYLKTSYITNQYNVTTTTVYNWIKGSRDGDNFLTLSNVNGKEYILDSEENHKEMQRLANNGKKNKPRFSYTKLTASKDFYSVFDSSQRVEIIHDLANYKEIQHKFTYLGIGAKRWGKYVEDSVQKKISNPTTNTAKLLETIDKYISTKLPKNTVNIFDIGVGDAYPVKYYLSRLLESKILKHYIPLDISVEIINMALENTKSWFGDKINQSGYVLDIANHNFRDIAAKHSDADKNIILFLGSTIENLRNKIETILNIKNSMENGDLLVLSFSLDIENSDKPIRYPDLKDSPDEKLGLKKRWIPELLGITKDMYEVKDLYNYDTSERLKYIVFNHDIEISFDTEVGEKIISFRAGEQLLVWRHSHHTLKSLVEKMENYGFNVEASINSHDSEQTTLVLSLKSSMAY